MKVLASVGIAAVAGNWLLLLLAPLFCSSVAAHSPLMYALLLVAAWPLARLLALVSVAVAPESRPRTALAPCPRPLVLLRG